jgi:hypothetical protein
MSRLGSEYPLSATSGYSMCAAECLEFGVCSNRETNYRTEFVAVRVLGAIRDQYERTSQPRPLVVGFEFGSGLV